MAVSTVRRKRIIAIIFAVCLVTALFLYRKGVRETWDGVEVGETSKGDFSRLDLSDEPAAEITTSPLPTKIYSVTEFEDETEESVAEQTERIDENRDKTTRDEDMKTSRKSRLEKQAGDKMEHLIENEDWEFKKGKITQENKIEETGIKKDDRQENRMEGRTEEGKDGMKSTEDQEVTEERKNESLMSDESRRREESRMRDETRRKEESRRREESRRKDKPRSGDQSRRRDEARRIEEPPKIGKFLSTEEKRADSVDAHDDRKQSNVYKVMAGYVKSTVMPKGPLSPAQSVQSELTLKFSTGVESSKTTKNLETKAITVPILNAKTTKATWVNKTTEVNNPRLRKIRQPTKKADQPTVRQNILSPRTTTSPTEEPLACKIPSLDPFHPHVSRLQNSVGTNLRKICRSMYPYTPVFKVVNNKLVLKDDVKEGSIVKSSIELSEIRRQSDEGFRYRNARNPFAGFSNLHESNDIGQSDFFRLKYKIDGRRASDLYARVSPKLDVLEKQSKLAKQFQDKGLPLNVLIIGFDSISRANFVRKLPRVKTFLETELNTYFMEGMSIVGDATTPVLAAMLTGKDESVLPEGRTSFGGRPIDNWPWIMKDYERQGYMTLYAEDDPSVSAFNLRLRGFSQSPTHHYMRPFWLSLEAEHERDEPGRCSKSESMVNHTLKYIKSFFDAYPTSRKFAFSFHSYLAHAHPNHLSLAEEDLMWFLRTFVDRGYLKDTMLVIMGDHGSRNWEYRGTMQGKLEERLPWFSISLPSEFHRKFPDLAANLRSNQAVITSSFDVHATLRHILTYPNMPSGEQTQSLFEKLPRNRTCSDAGIAEHWCPCFQWLPTDVKSKDVQSIAVSAVKLINDKLSNVPLDSSCHKLSLDNVVDAVTLRANKKVQTFYSTDQDGDRSVNFADRTQDLTRYQIIFTTQPNEAKYEVTAHVSSSRHQVTVNPEISRLNRYNDQPACIAKQYPYARKFCYCRTSA